MFNFKWLTGSVILWGLSTAPLNAAGMYEHSAQLAAGTSDDMAFGDRLAVEFSEQGSAKGVTWVQFTADRIEASMPRARGATVSATITCGGQTSEVSVQVKSLWLGTLGELTGRLTNKAFKAAGC